MTQLRQSGGQDVRLRGSGQHLIIGWDAQAQAPTLRIAGPGGRPIAAFVGEVRQGATVLWAGASVAGRLVLPPAVGPSPAASAPPMELVILLPAASGP